MPTRCTTDSLPETNALSCAPYGARPSTRSQTRTTQEQRVVLAHSAVPWAVLPSAVRPLHASAMGLSIFLLVSVRLGNPGVGASRNRLPQTQNVAGTQNPADTAWQHEDVETGRQGRTSCCPAAMGERRATRRQHTGRVTWRMVCYCRFSCEARRSHLWFRLC